MLRLPDRLPALSSCPHQTHSRAPNAQSQDDRPTVHGQVDGHTHTEVTAVPHAPQHQLCLQAAVGTSTGPWGGHEAPRQAEHVTICV